MVGEIVTGVGLFKSMLDMAKGLKDINDAAVRNAAVIELQEKILAAREAQSTLAEQVRDLEAEVARLKAWDREKERYELQQRSPNCPGALAYRVKESERGAEPVHWLCPTCYEDGRKSILQEHEGARRSINAACPRCKTTLSFYE